ncbi:MAG: fibronectin type III domain-containing protein [Muribaculaceae bacterium]|nr:fibronectin type III domain-containing protein [Muribaculaceae bacterium]
MKKFTLVASMAIVSMMAWARPDSPSAFKMTFDLNGGNPIVTGSFVCPTGHLYSEEQIQKITKVKVIRGCYDVGEKDIVAYESEEEREPGSLVEFTDEFGELECGYTYTYEAKIYDEKNEESWGSTFRLYCGIEPGKPTITVALGDKGSLPVTLTVVAPETTASGETLTVPLTQLRVVEYVGYQNEREIKIINDPISGKSYEVVDSEAVEGQKYSYRAYASCEFGTSEQGWVEIYVGEDMPGAPKDLLLTENEDGSVTLTWTAPDKGKNDGYLDLASVRYKVIRKGDEPKDLAEDLSECSYTDALDGLTGPTVVKYEVLAYNTLGEGESVMSSELMKGPSYQLPFEENFNAEEESYWGIEYVANKKWTFESTSWYASWEITDSPYYLGDVTGVGDGEPTSEDGFAFANCGYADPGENGTMTSSAIDVKSASYPVLSFYCLAKANDPITFTVGVESEGEKKDLLTIVPGDEQTEQTPVWNRHMISLEEMAGNEIKLIFTAQIPEDAEEYTYTGIGLDRIIIADYPGIDKVSVAETADGLEVSWVAPKNSYDEEPESYDVVVDDAEPVNVTDTKHVIMATRADGAENHKVSVRANYGDIQGKFSPMFDAVPGGSLSGISTIGGNGNVKVEYFDVNGLPVAKAMKGSTIIRRTVSENGSVKVEKMIVKE